MNLAQALAELSDPDGIAAHLLARGIRGRRGSACVCPLAAYLTSLGFGDPTVSVLGIGALIDGKHRRTPIRSAALEFIRRFDSGEWPELVLDDAAEVDRG